jgi:UDP:flavonoid glycosyltransferase YjiC (YdhE family)
MLCNMGGFTSRDGRAVAEMMVVQHPLLFTPTSNVLAHVGRSVILARALQERGHRIAIAGMAKYLRDPGVVRAGEFAYHQLPDFDLAEGLEVLRSLHKLPRRQAIERNIAAELALLDALRPQAVVVDFRPTMYISARLRRIPLIALLGGRWLYQYAAKPYPAFRTYAHYAMIRKLFGVRGADRLMPPVQRLVMRYKTAPFARAFKRHGLPARRTPWDMLVGDYNLILDTELVCPTRPLPANFVKVGPIFWSPEQPLPAWLTQLEHRRPIIYVTLGSTAHPDLFRQLLRIFSGLEATILMTTGGQITLHAREIPAHVHVEKYLPGTRVMQLADLVIHHGGAGTVYQTIQAAKPSIAIATHFEQELVSAILEEQGVGIVLTMQEVMAAPQRLTQAVTEMLRCPGPYLAHLQRLQDDLKQYDPVRTAADHIEGFLATWEIGMRGKTLMRNYEPLC